MKTYIQQASNLVIQYVMPAVKKNNLKPEDFDHEFVSMFSKGIVDGMCTTRMFRDWVDAIVKSKQ